MSSTYFISGNKRDKFVSGRGVKEFCLDFK